MISKQCTTPPLQQETEMADSWISSQQPSVKGIFFLRRGEFLGEESQRRLGTTQFQLEDKSLRGTHSKRHTSPSLRMETEARISLA